MLKRHIQMKWKAVHIISKAVQMECIARNPLASYRNSEKLREGEQASERIKRSKLVALVRGAFIWEMEPFRLTYDRYV